VKGAAWAPRFRPEHAAIAQAIREKTQCDPLIAQVIAARGATPASVRSWFDPKLRDLMVDPADFADMAAAIQRIADAIDNREQIAVFGDYDVDGACSTALIASYLHMIGAPNALYYIPDRVLEGYGLNSAAVQTLAQKATLLIAVDCGTTAHAELLQAQLLGLDTIVIDHHEPDPELPTGLVVNPKRPDDLSGEPTLCAAGVVFMMLAGLNRELRRRGRIGRPDPGARPEPDLRELTPLVALATIADVAPLTALNRAFVRTGLANLNDAPSPGLSALLTIAETKTPITPSDVGFQIAPRLNAGGRLGDSQLATRLLLTTDPEEARRIAADLDSLNRERRALEQEAVASVIATTEALARENQIGAAVFAIGENWHPGVAGLIAARVAEAYQRPAFAITFQGASGVGSARSGGGADIGMIVKEAAATGLIERGGGHAAAAGLALTKEQLPDFEAFVNKRLSEAPGAAGPPVTLHDGPLSAQTPRHLLSLIEHLDDAGPYGAANPAPIFVLENAVVTQLKTVGANHLKFVATAAGLPFALAIIAFRSADTTIGAFLQESAAAKRPVGLLVAIEINEFRGDRTPQARLLDCARMEELDNA